jgi:hypothetical protein
VGIKPELQTCARDESCQFDCVHKIFIPSPSNPSAMSVVVIETSESENSTCASSHALSSGVRLINWVSCGVA